MKKGLLLLTAFIVVIGLGPAAFYREEIGIGGGYGHTGTDLEADGDIFTNGNLKVDGTATITGGVVGLTIGTNVQAWDTDLDALAGLTYGADLIAYFTATHTAATTTLTTFGRSLIDDANATAARSTLGSVIGTNVEAWDNDLDDIAALTPTNNYFMVGDGTDWKAEQPSDARTSLSLVPGTDVQAYDAELGEIAALADTDSNFIVGNGSAWVAETGATARTSMGLGTGDSPTFVMVNANLTGNVTGNVSGSSGSCTGNAATATLAANSSQLLTYTWAIPGTIGSTTPNTVSGTTITATSAFIPATGLTAFVTSNSSPQIYRSNTNGGAYPFDAYGNLVIQSRSSATQDIVFVTGTTPAVSGKISGATGNMTLYQSLTVTGDITSVTGGDIDLGVTGTTRGTADLFRGSGGNTPGYLMLVAGDGDDGYLYQANDGYVRFAAAAPDGTVTTGQRMIDPASPGDLGTTTPPDFIYGALINGTSTLWAGQNDTTEGTAAVFGGVNHDASGCLQLYLPDADDSPVNSWRIKPYMDGGVARLEIQADTTPIVSIGQTTGLNTPYGFTMAGKQVSTPSSAQAIVAATGITAAMCAYPVTRVVGSGGAVDITAVPQIADGTDGQVVEFEGTDDTNTVKFDDGNGINSGGVSYTLGKNDVLNLRYHAADDVWLVRFGKDN